MAANRKLSEKMGVGGVFALCDESGHLGLPRVNEGSKRSMESTDIRLLNHPSDPWSEADGLQHRDRHPKWLVRLIRYGMGQSNQLQTLGVASCQVQMGNKSWSRETGLLPLFQSRTSASPWRAD
jgi:hypothetical protein